MPKQYIILHVSIHNMFSFFKNKSIQRASFEDIQYAIQYPDSFIIINTLPINEQNCLISNTISCYEEEKLMNDLINVYEFKKKQILVYGKNANDETAVQKYNQLYSLGFSYVFLYTGGLFEWLMLQDIYGKDEFKTTSHILDLLKYKPSNNFSRRLL